MDRRIAGVSLNELEKLSGIVERVTFHSPESGWSVLKVKPFDTAFDLVAVRVHQAQVFAGATMEFYGHWRHHPRYGDQFEAERALERKPATAAGLERYLGSGLIRGVGPKTAHKIVKHFGAQTLDVFDTEIERLVEVRGIAQRKLEAIGASWKHHTAVRDVMLFLQEHGVSTLFATKIYKTYGDQAIEVVSTNPYRLAEDIYGIGFFSADRIALTLGMSTESNERGSAGIRHVLAASRDQGHCFLTADQIVDQCVELLKFQSQAEAGRARLRATLERLAGDGRVATRNLLWPPPGDSATREDPPRTQTCYYSRGLYRDERDVFEFVRRRATRRVAHGTARARDWLARFGSTQAFPLSQEQSSAVVGIIECAFSIFRGIA